MDKKPTRRRFLQAAVGGAVAVALEGAAAAGKTVDSPETDEYEKAYWKLFNEKFVPLFGWQNRMKEAGVETVIPHTTLDELNMLRDLFLADFHVSHHGEPTYVEEMVAAGVLTGERAHRQLLFLMQLFGVQGHVYDSLTPEEYKKLRNSLETTWKEPASYRGQRSTIETHFAVRAQDFIPTGANLVDTDIDPRVFRVARTKPWSAYRRDINRQLRHREGWTQESRKAAFRQAFDNQEIRHMFEDTDCSMIEMFSIVRYVLEDQEFNSEPLVPIQPDRVQKYIRRREEAKTLEFISPNTECFISITHVEDRRDDNADAIRAVCGVQEDAHVRVDTASKSKALFSLHEALRKTEGNTCVFINSHGYDPLYESLDSSFTISEGSSISAKQLAESLVNRIVAFQDPQALKSVSLVLGPCYGASIMMDVYEHIPQIVMEKMAEYQNATPEREVLQQAAIQLANKKFNFPVACTLSPQDGYGYLNLFSDSITMFEKAVAKKGYTGAMFMKLQAYYAANMVDPVLFGRDGQPVV